MNWYQHLSFSQACVLLISIVGGVVILAGCWSYMSLLESDRAHRRSLRKYDARAQRNAFRDAKGLTKL